MIKSRIIEARFDDLQRAPSLPTKSKREAKELVLEYHMEFLETFGCIWSSKEVIKVIIGRAIQGIDLPE
ncbi:hypothetical protein DY000_02053812 [Brassica cretica]|uniref:Uncharacterized protein n=1 Tax=Brassica cretica TaxID=69181 RepID=A0ABQ7A9K2_BRACR|nr:hypothetical protein DY000_02053812 [Brassica cretica]